MHELLKLYEPELMEFMEGMGLGIDNAQTYCVKWFCGLGLHFMPFSAMFVFWEKFLKEGEIFMKRDI